MDNAQPALEDALEPCPFCGCDASKHEADSDGPIWIECDMCGVRGADFRWEDNAKAAWNARAAIAALTPARSALEAERDALRKALVIAIGGLGSINVTCWDRPQSPLKPAGDKARATLTALVEQLGEDEYDRLALAAGETQHDEDDPGIDTSDPAAGEDYLRSIGRLP